MASHAEIPRAGLVISTLLSMVTIAVLAVCLTRRIQATREWGEVPLTKWLLFAIYIDSMAFILVTSVLEYGFGLNSNQAICSAAILVCLVCYMTTKLIYYFLVEKVYIIRRVQSPRLKSKLYCFNCFGMLLPYCVVVILNFIFRMAYFDEGGICIIGMRAKAMMPLIIFDAIVNVYLTMLFVIPLRGLYSYQNSPSSKLRTIALRSFIGSLGTLTSSVVNLTVLMVLKGEAAWICLMCCNGDILFSVLVLYWVTSKDSPTSSSANLNSNHGESSTRSGPAPAAKDANGTASKLDRWGYGSRGAKGKATGVATYISSGVLGEGDGDRDLQRVDWGHKDGGEGKAFAMGGITVEIEQVVEVEGRGGNDKVSMINGEELSRARSHQSTEDLVERPLQPVR